MRLALALGRTVQELEQTMNADEWADWLLFHELYDLPDGFLVAAQLGTLVSRALGGSLAPEDISAYYRSDHLKEANVSRGIAFAVANVERKKLNAKKSKSGDT